MAEATVSVIIPTYNRARLVGRAIRSVLRQCGAGDEVLVVDDGSKDNTAAVVAEFGPAVRYIQVRNGGAGRARNIALRQAKGTFVAFLDSDDQWFDGKLPLQRALMQARPDLLFSFSNFAVTLNSGEPVHRYLEKWLTAPLTWQEALGPGVPLSSLVPLGCLDPSSPGAGDPQVHIGDLSAAELIDNYVLTSSIMVRREEAGDALHFDEALTVFEDWYCFARLSLRGPAAYIDCETTWQHGAGHARLTDAGTLIRAQAWHVVNDRVWAPNAEFRRRHAARYERATRIKRLELARGLIGCGQTKEARRVLSGAADAPYSYRVLSRLPGVLIRSLAAARRRFLLPA